MKHAVAVLLVLALATLSGCASTAPPGPAARPFDTVRRIAVVATGESQFTVNENSAEPGRTFDEILTWAPTAPAWVRPLAQLVHRGINWLLELDRKADAASELAGIVPREVVAASFAAALAASEQLDEIRVLKSEPIGEDRRRAEAIVRLAVPAWGLVRVRVGEPDLVSAFADARAEMIVRDTGIVFWERSEDVTDVERLPLTTFTSDRKFTRQQLLDVLDRAGRRLASEYLYARSAGR